MGKSSRWLLLVGILLGFHSSVAAFPSPEVISRLTREIVSYNPTWTEAKTRNLLVGSEDSAYFTTSVPTNKKIVRIEVMGDVVLVNGKDISGDLRSKQTGGPKAFETKSPQRSIVCRPKSRGGGEEATHRLCLQGAR